MMYRLLPMLLTNARPLLFTAALAAVTIGLWWERPSLALIVPGALVASAMSWSYVRGGYT